jgi:hypothetical protein
MAVMVPVDPGIDGSELDGANGFVDHELAAMHQDHAHMAILRLGGELDRRALK